MFMKKTRRPLTLWDRQIIVAMQEQGYGVREIGRYLKRDASIVSRELWRNRLPPRVKATSIEWAQWAHDRAKERLKLHNWRSPSEVAAECALASAA